MADVPCCPNFVEGKCERNEQVLAGETEQFWNFWCRCCKSTWIVSKPKTKARGAYQAKVDRIAKATVREKERMVFGSHYAGTKRG